jgi:hypothetical protein
MTLRRLLLNLATALALTALVVLCLFAHLSMMVRPEEEQRMAQIDFEPGAWKEMR